MKAPVIVSFVSGKGGVGKSSNSIFLANYLAAWGKNILFLDTDFNNSATLYYLQNRTELHGKGYSAAITKKSLSDNIVATPKQNIDLIPSDFNTGKLETKDTGLLANLLNAEKDLLCVYDYIIIDTAQGFTNSTTLSAILASDVIFTPLRLCQFDIISASTLQSKLIQETDKYDSWKPFFNSVPYYAFNRNSIYYQYITLFHHAIPSCIDIYIPQTTFVTNAIDRAISVTRKAHTRLYEGVQNLVRLISTEMVPDVEGF